LADFHTSRYQFNPTLYNSDVVIHILIKALTSSPFPDFHLCVSLLDERPSSANADEPDPLPSILPQLQQLYALLQQCRFPAFWSLYLSEEYRVLREEYTVESVSFEDSVRKVVIRAVKAAFTKIGVKRLSSYFNLERMSFPLNPNENSTQWFFRDCI
jgi:translation initiation factor 3 subunit K